MSIHIVLGWWLLPAVVTIASFGWATWASKDDIPSGGAYSFAGFLTLLCMGAAAIASLIAWLIWALVT